MLIAFGLGVAAFLVPVGMLFSRSPVIEMTDFHINPPTVVAGQKFEAVWIDKTLREGCGGVVHRRFIAMNGIDVWVFPPVHTVKHGAVGSSIRFHTPWIAPDVPAGTQIVLSKDIGRWCNVIQNLVWPMWEHQEAPFSIVSERERRQP